MSRKFFPAACALILGAGVLSGSPSFAATTLLLPTQTVTPNTGTVTSVLGTGYTVVDTQSFTGITNGTTTYDLLVDVVKLQSGRIDFLYQVTNSTGSNPINSLDVADYTSTATRVAQITDATSLTGGNFTTNGTVNIDKADRNTSGSNVTFNFVTPAVGMGQTSLVMVVATNRVGWNDLGTASGASTGFTGSAAQNNVFQPALTSPTVPEPSSLVLGGLALVTGACIYRRRRV